MKDQTSYPETQMNPRPFVRLSICIRLKPMEKKMIALRVETFFRKVVPTMPRKATSSKAEGRASKDIRRIGREML